MLTSFGNLNELVEVRPEVANIKEPCSSSGQLQVLGSMLIA
jgi:hypothetical protein